MTFRIKLNREGRDFFTGVLPSMDRNFRGGIRSALQQAGFNLVKTAKDGIQRQTKQGVVYSRRGRRKRASSGGQYPGIVEGKTLAGIDFEIKGASQMEFGIRDRIGKGSKDVPKFLEDGTSKMEARPTLGLSHAAREKDTFNYLRRLPLDRMKKGR